MRNSYQRQSPELTGYVLWHDQEKIVIRNYEGNIFEYPETGADQTVQFAPQREYHDEYLYS
jgi:hypothetical protein